MPLDLEQRKRLAAIGMVTHLGHTPDFGNEVGQVKQIASSARKFQNIQARMDRAEDFHNRSAQRISDLLYSIRWDSGSPLVRHYGTILSKHIPKQRAEEYHALNKEKLPLRSDLGDAMYGFSAGDNMRERIGLANALDT